MNDTEATDLVPVEDQRVAVRQDAQSMHGLLELAINKGVSVEALEKLVTLNERVMDRYAAQEFAAALSKFQSACPTIQKTSTAKIVSKKGTTFFYKYAELDEIAKTIRPHLEACGLSYTWDSALASGSVKCTCILRHANGHKAEATFEAPVDTEAAMNATQANGAALTYARRQALVQVLGLTTSDSDPDGGVEDVEKITASQVADLESLRSEVGAKLDRFLLYMRVGKLEDIKATDYAMAVAALKAKRK